MRATEASGPTTCSATGRPTKAELEAQRDEREHERHLRRMGLWESVIRYGGIAVWIVVAIVPLLVLNSIAAKLAGEDTNVTITIGLSIAVSVAVSGVAIATRVKLRRQGEELKRLRSRTDKLVQELEECREKGSSS